MLTCSLPVAGLVWKQETAKSSSWMGYLLRLLGIVPNLPVFCMDLLGVNLHVADPLASNKQGTTSSLNRGKQSHRRMATHTVKPWFIFMAWEVRPKGMLEEISRWEESGWKWVWFKNRHDWSILKCWFSHWRRTLLWKHIGSGVDYLQADSELLWPWRLGASYAPGLRAVFPSAPLLQQPWGETLGSWSLGQWTNMVWWPDGLSLPFSKSKPWRRQVSICWYH